MDGHETCGELVREVLQLPFSLHDERSSVFMPMPNPETEPLAFTASTDKVLFTLEPKGEPAVKLTEKDIGEKFAARNGERMTLLKIDNNHFNDHPVRMVSDKGAHYLYTKDGHRIDQGEEWDITVKLNQPTTFQVGDWVVLKGFNTVGQVVRVHHDRGSVLFEMVWSPFLTNGDRAPFERGRHHSKDLRLATPQEIAAAADAAATTGQPQEEIAIGDTVELLNCEVFFKAYPSARAKIEGMKFTIKCTHPDHAPNWQFKESWLESGEVCSWPKRDCRLVSKGKSQGKSGQGKGTLPKEPVKLDDPVKRTGAPCSACGGVGRVPDDHDRLDETHGIRCIKCNPFVPPTKPEKPVLVPDSEYYHVSNGTVYLQDPHCGYTLGTELEQCKMDEEEDLRNELEELALRRREIKLELKELNRTSVQEENQ